MLRLSSPFLLDLRSIVVFRVLLGSIMLYDVVARMPYAGLFLSDEGALSRSDLLASSYRPWSFSLYMMFGGPIQAQAALLAHAIAAIALVLGYRTRAAIIVCWVMLLSLQHRNPLVLNGGDTLLALYVFWALFLPLNARFSLDRLLAKRQQGGVWPQKGENRYHAVPGAALLMQTVFVYLFTWILKSGDLWRSGEAVGYVLRNSELITSNGVWFQQLDSLHPLFTRLTYHWEWLGLVLLLCPVANGVLRVVAIAGFVLMHLVFGLMLDLALFPAVSIAGWLALLPPRFWALAARAPQPRWLLDMLGRATERLRNYPWPGGRPMLPGKGSAIICAIAIALVFLWNARSLPESPLAERIPKPVEDLMYAFKLRQKWSMFAADPPRNTRWYAIEAQLANGDTVDLFHPTAPYSLRPPQVFVERLPDRRWGKFLGALRKKRHQRLRDDFLTYLASRWNERAAPSHRIEKATLVYFRERIQLGGGYAQAQSRALETIWPPGVYQVRTAVSAIEEVESDGELYEENEDL